MPRHHQPTQTVLIAQGRLWLITPLRALLVFALAVIAAGCSAATVNNETVPQHVDEVHQAWIAAVREGDGDVALALTDPRLPQREQFAHEAVNHMQDYLTNPASPTGALLEVTVEPVSDGVGRSVWQFATKRWCYRTALVSRDEHWYVSRWGQTSVNCQ
jgi:hypothetical protein